MNVTGLFEAHLTVSDLRRSLAFYRDILGLPLASEFPERQAAFCWIGAPGRAMLGLWETSAPVGLRLHIALAANVEDVIAAVGRLSAAGVTPLDFSGNPTDTPIVIGWMPAIALYMKDPDGHSIELISMLPDAPRPDRGVLSWPAWRA